MSDPVDVEKILQDHDLVTAVLARATRDALRQHKAAGNPICVWRDEKVVWIPADQIEIVDDSAPQE